jgi:hypothetical protein
MTHYEQLAGSYWRFTDQPDAQLGVPTAMKDGSEYYYYSVSGPGIPDGAIALPLRQRFADDQKALRNVDLVAQVLDETGAVYWYEQDRIYAGEKVTG